MAKHKQNEQKTQFKTIKAKLSGQYNGHNILRNGGVNIRFTFGYSEISEYVKFLQILNQNISLKVKLDDEIIDLGTFTIKAIKVSGDGECTVTFDSEVDSCKLTHVSDLIGAQLFISATASIELEDDEEYEDE